MKTYKKGISLIVLVITVIVLAILATTVIISLSNTNIITEANEAVIKSRFKSMQEQLTVYVAEQLTVTNGTFKMEDLDAESKSSTIDTVFPELKDSKYYDYVSLIDGNIVLAAGMPDREIALEVISEYEEPEVITNYTQVDIDASNGKIIAIGATNALDVVGVYSDDGKTLTITKNGITSDGKIKDRFLPEEDYENEEDYDEEVVEKKYEAFLGIRTVNIKKGITTIGEDIFNTAGAENNIENITIPNSVTSIGRSAFNSCYSLESITIPDSVTYIGEYAFAYCENLESIIIPDGVTHIGPYAFESCTSLERIIFENSSGWKAGETSILSTDLANPSTAATYLKETYFEYGWIRE